MAQRERRVVASMARAYTRDTFNRIQFTTIQCRRCHPFFFLLSQFSFFSLLLPSNISILFNTAFAFGTETFVRFAFIETKGEGKGIEKEKNTIKNVRMHVCVCVYCV